MKHEKQKGKKSGILRISYPITDEVRQTLDKYPAIKRKFRLPDSQRSELEIIRLLLNTHYDHIRKLLSFIDEWLASSKIIGKKLLETKHPLDLKRVLAELFLFAHLSDRIMTPVNPPGLKNSNKHPDLEIQFNDLLVRIEVYTPVDFFGFQLLLTYIQQALKYLEIAREYHLAVEIEPLPKQQDYDQEDLFYPYTVPNESEVHTWLHKFRKMAYRWLSQRNPEQEITVPGPGEKINVVIKLLEFNNNEKNRCVKLSPATRSTDTRLFFEIGRPEDTARSQWGHKIKEKIEAHQCGDQLPNTLRILVINFALADTGWPHFISDRRFAVRFNETIKLLVEGEKPFDIVLPARLHFDCCFGHPTWITESTTQAEEFLQVAELNKLCQPRPDKTLDDIKEFFAD